MNPLDWKRQHQLAGIAFCAVGAIAGIFLAWMDSPFRRLSSHSVSGEWANVTNVFLLWLSHVGLYWPWPLMGACAAGLAFFGVQLTSTVKPLDFPAAMKPSAAWSSPGRRRRESDLENE